MERCRVALMDFKSRDSYCVIRESRNSGDVLNGNSTTYYYRSGKDWLYHTIIGNGDEDWETYMLEKDGGRYRQEVTTFRDPADGNSTDSGWIAEPEMAAYDPWLVSFYWDGADMELTALSDDGNRVTFTIQGSPYPTDHGRIVEVAEYEATFCLAPGTGTLQCVTLDYHASWTVYIDERESTGTGSVSEVYSVQDMTAEQSAAVIEAQTVQDLV